MCDKNIHSSYLMCCPETPQLKLRDIPYWIRSSAIIPRSMQHANDLITILLFMRFGIRDFILPAPGLQYISDTVSEAENSTKNQ